MAGSLQVQQVTISAFTDLVARLPTCPRFGDIGETMSAVVCPLSIRYFAFSESPGFDLRDQMKTEDMYRYTSYRHTKNPDRTYGHLLDLQG
jgi:hypothetical protein